MAETPPAVTTDAVLGGRVVLTQPARGHRFGHDAVLLAADVPALPGEHVLDLGAGVGAAALCLAARVPVAALTLVEIDPALAALAARNAAANGLADRTRVVVADILRADALACLPAADRAIANPPFHDAARHRASPAAARRTAHHAPAGLLDAFVRRAVAALRPGGTLTLIHRGDQAEALLAAMKGRFGGLAIRPVHPRPGAPAVRLIVTGAKGSRAPARVLPGLVLADDRGRPTPEAEAVLREGRGL